jgi:hypothetical protein
MAAWGEAQLTLPAGFPMAVGEELKRDFRDAGPGSAASFTIDTIAASTLPGTYTFGVNVSSDDPFDASASSSFPVTVYSALPPPALVSPGKGARGVSQNPTLTWNASAGATSYDVYLGASSYSPYTGSSVSPTLLASTAGTSYTAGALNPGTLYYWQIVARNSSGASSSATWSFMTQAPQTEVQRSALS